MKETPGLKKKTQNRGGGGASLNSPPAFLS